MEHVGESEEASLPLFRQNEIIFTSYSVNKRKQSHESSKKKKKDFFSMFLMSDQQGKAITPAMTRRHPVSFGKHTPA